MKTDWEFGNKLPINSVKFGVFNHAVNLKSAMNQHECIETQPKRKINELNLI